MSSIQYIINYMVINIIFRITGLHHKTSCIAVCHFLGWTFLFKIHPKIWNEQSVRLVSLMGRLRIRTKGVRFATSSDNEDSLHLFFSRKIHKLWDLTGRRECDVREAVISTEVRCAQLRSPLERGCPERITDWMIGLKISQQFNPLSRLNCCEIWAWSVDPFLRYMVSKLVNF